MKKLLLLLSLVLFTNSFSSENFKISSEEYRGWNHVKSMVIYSESHPLFNPFGGIHHIYANDKGLKTVKKCSSRKFKEGSVLVFVLYKANESNGAFTEGVKKIEAFMVKNSKKYKNTNGWGYFAYMNGKNIVKNMRKDCHSCHSQVKNKDYVFSCWTR